MRGRMVDTDKKYGMQGIRVERDGEILKLVGTTAHRLHLAEIPTVDACTVDLEPGTYAVLKQTKSLAVLDKTDSVFPNWRAVVSHPKDGKVAHEFTMPERKYVGEVVGRVIGRVAERFPGYTLNADWVYDALLEIPRSCSVELIMGKAVYSNFGLEWPDGIAIVWRNGGIEHRAVLMPSYSYTNTAAMVTAALED